MPKKTATFLDTARTFYGDAFEVHRKRDLAQSMTEWTELADDEQRFTVAHLLYLNLHAEAATHRMLGHVCQLLDEVAEAFSAAVELSLEPDPEDVEPHLPDPGPPPDVIDAEPPTEEVLVE
jgi:hypothetical protein